MSKKQSDSVHARLVDLYSGIICAMCVRIRLSYVIRLAVMFLTFKRYLIKTNKSKAYDRICFTSTLHGTV